MPNWMSKSWVNNTKKPVFYIFEDIQCTGIWQDVPWTKTTNPVIEMHTGFQWICIAKVTLGQLKRPALTASWNVHLIFCLYIYMFRLRFYKDILSEIPPPIFVGFF